ncbi:MAG: DUF4432 family protein [Planctomycetota bacterium]|jgi:hypothetical protein
MATKDTGLNWQNKVNNYAQIGGIETSVLDNGLAKGTRIAWINTGSGLRFKVIIDRALDIVDAFYNQYSLAWLSHAGVTSPRPDANRGLEWLYSFGGGLLTTCGLTHVGGPETDEFGERGLHGRISNIPGRIESIVQPDLLSEKLQMSITAVITPAPHMILYHCNYGFPLVDEGTQILCKGKWASRGLDMDNAVFNSRRNFRKCSKPLDSHRAGGEGCAFINAAADKKGICTAGLYNRKLGLALVLKYKKRQLPWLSNWQHFGPGEYVTALEPGTNPPIGQGIARKQKKLIHIAPGKSKTYDLEMTILTDKDQIKSFVKAAGQ